MRAYKPRLIGQRPKYDRTSAPSGQTNNDNMPSASVENFSTHRDETLMFFLIYDSWIVVRILQESVQKNG